MMKEFLLVRNRRHPRLRRAPLVLALFLTFLLVGALLLFSPQIRGALVSFMLPLWRAERAVINASKVLPDQLSSKGALITEIEKLRGKLREADSALRRFRVLEEENVKLKELLGRQSYESVVLAAVLGRPAVTPYDTLLIDTGNSLVDVGDRVIVDGSIMIGTISEVHKRTAQVLLFSAPGVETQVQVGPERIPITARGQGGGSFVAEFPRDGHVEEGYSIVFPGINPYLFSVVESAEASEADAFVLIRFKNPVNIQAITWVQVLTDAGEAPPAFFPSKPNTGSATSTDSDVNESVSAQE